MAERVGFEPTYRLLTDNSISSRARYGQLRYLSAGAKNDFYRKAAARASLFHAGNIPCPQPFPEEAIPERGLRASRHRFVLRLNVPACQECGLTDSFRA